MTRSLSSISKLSFFFSKTAINTYFIFFGNAVSLVFAFIFTVLLVRLLNVSDFGYFSALFTFLLMMAEIFDLGIGNSLSRFLPTIKEKSKNLIFVKSAFLLQVLLGLSVSTIIFFLSSLIADFVFHQASLSFLVRVVSVGIFALISANFFLYTLMAREKFTKASILTAFNGIFRVITLLVLVFLFSKSLSSSIFAQAISLILLAILGFSFVGSSFLSVKIDFVKIKQLLSFSIFIGAARGVTSVVSKLDVLMLVYLASPTQAGIYSIASRVASMYPVLTGSFINVIAPKIASFKEKKTLTTFLKKVVIATILINTSSLFLILISKPFLLILFGQKAIFSIAVFRLLLVAMIFFISSIPAVSVAIYFLKKPWIITVNSIIQLTIVVFGNIYFIPKFANIGPALSLILAYGITFLSTSLMSYYFLKSLHD